MRHPSFHSSGTVSSFSTFSYFNKPVIIKYIGFFFTTNCLSYTEYACILFISPLKLCKKFEVKKKYVLIQTSDFMFKILTLTLSYHKFRLLVFVSSFSVFDIHVLEICRSDKKKPGQHKL